jgi:DedD protein
MEEGSKRRLAGTAVVVVLLVIFVPMLLEEEPSQRVPDSDLEIPPRPALEAGPDEGRFETSAESLALPSGPELPPPDIYEALPGVPERPTAAEEPPADPEEAPDRGSAAASSPPPPARTAPTKEPDVAAVEQPPTEPASMPAQDGPGWVLQVSSLTERSRAERLKGELSSEGFPVFIEMADVGGKTYHRVRIGPRTDRADIQAIADAVKTKTGYEGQILRYR